jgi:hypothetical protein
MPRSLKAYSEKNSSGRDIRRKRRTNKQKYYDSLANSGLDFELQDASTLYNTPELTKKDSAQDSSHIFEIEPEAEAMIDNLFKNGMTMSNDGGRELPKLGKRPFPQYFHYHWEEDPELDRWGVGDVLPGQQPIWN